MGKQSSSSRGSSYRSSGRDSDSSRSSSTLSASDKASFSGLSFIDESGDTESCNLLVANIATQVSEQTLWKTFGKYGPIEELQIILPESTKSGELHKFNYALVKFTERSISEEAKKSMDGMYSFFMFIV